MENRAHAIVAVCFLIILSVGAALIYYWLSSGPQTPRLYRIVTKQSVAGLQPQSKVMFKGLQVGYVESIHFDSQNGERIIVDFRVRPDTYITHDTYAVLSTQGLIGGKILKLEAGKGKHKPLPTDNSDPAHIPLHQGLIGQLEQAAQDNLQQLHTLLAGMNSVLSEDNRNHISDIMAQLDTLTGQLVTLEKQLSPAIGALPQLLDHLNDTVDQTQTLLTHVDKLAQQAQKPIKGADKLEATIGALGNKLNRHTLPEINALSKSLTRTSQQLQKLTKELKETPQSIIFGPPKPKPGPGEPGFSSSNSEGGAHE